MPKAKDKTSQKKDPFTDQAAILRAMRKAVRQAIEMHAQAGRKLPVMRNGKVVMVPAATIKRQMDQRRASKRPAA